MEDQYLELTASGDDESAYKLLEPLFKTKAFDSFDSRISGLAWRAYERDLAVDPESKAQYERAMEALADVDEMPNLGMFVNCIALETPPEKLEPRSMPLFVVLVVLVFTALVIWAMWRH